MQASQLKCDEPRCGRAITQAGDVWSLRVTAEYFCMERGLSERVTHIACSQECASKMQSRWMNDMLGVRAA